MTPGDRIGELEILAIHDNGKADLVCSCGQVVTRKITALRTARSHGARSTCKGCRVDRAARKFVGFKSRLPSYGGIK